MSYIIVVRTRKGDLIPVIKPTDGEEIIAEYDTEWEAAEAAQNTMACQAWPYEVLEVNL